MQKTPLTVSIPHPCQQSWEAMTPAAGGRFCDSCRKTVIDFSGLTDSQVLELLSDPSKKYCGRFKQSQLDRQLQPAPQASLLPTAVLGALMAAAVPVTAATAGDHPTHIADTSGQRTITGKVTLADGTTMPGAFIVIKGTKWGAMADAEGRYQLKVPVASAGQPITLVFSNIGYVTAEVPLADQQTVDVTLKEDEYQLTGEVVVVGGVRRATVWERFKNKWRRFWHR